MIEAIRRIGEYAIEGDLTEDAYLNGICLNIPVTRINKGKSFEQHIVFLNFNTQTKKIEIDFEKVNAGGKESGMEYLWVGNNIGPKDQMFLTTDSPIYLFTKTLPNLLKKAHKDFKSDLEQILDGFFNDGIVDSSKFELLNQKAEHLKCDLMAVKEKVMYASTKRDLNEKINELKNICSKIDIKCDFSSEVDFENVKGIVESKCEELMNSNIEEKLNNKYKTDILKRLNQQGNKKESLLTNDLLLCRGIKKDEVSIYTVKLDGDLLVKRQEYRDIIYYEKIDKLFNIKDKNYSKNLATGKCSICENGESLATTSNATNLEFKFYMTDKIGFSSNLDGAFTKNYNICKECYQYLMIAENFIDNNLSTRIGGLKIYIIPHFIFKVDELNLKKFSESINDSTNSINNLESIKDFKSELERFREYESNKNNFVVNYLCYHKSKSEFKVLKLIKDIPPSRLEFISSKIQEICNLVDNNYGSNKRLKLDLNRIWYCIPTKGKEGSYFGFSRYLDILDAIFSNKIVDYNFLINQFTEVIRIIKFERKGYNIRIEQDFTDKIIQLNFLLLLFIKLKLLGGMAVGEKNNANTDEVGKGMFPKEILDYWNDVPLYIEKQKRALFLLGYLIGEIGNAQSATGHKTKPILDKINFQGMGVEKLIRLSNDVLEKLKQYGKLQYYEDSYSMLKLLLDNNIANWNLSNQENVFYSLSGYSFSNYLVRKRSKATCFEELRKVSEYIETEKTRDDSVRTKEMEKILEEAKKLAEEYRYSAAKKILKDIVILNKDKEVE